MFTGKTSIHDATLICFNAVSTKERDASSFCLMVLREGCIHVAGLKNRDKPFEKRYIKVTVPFLSLLIIRY